MVLSPTMQIIRTISRELDKELGALSDYDLEIATCMDIVKDKEPPEGLDADALEDWFYDHLVGVHFIQTIHDPSVGIFGLQLSPSFDDMKELRTWWKEHRDKICHELDKEEPNWKTLEKIGKEE